MRPIEYKYTATASDSFTTKEYSGNKRKRVNNIAEESLSSMCVKLSTRAESLMDSIITERRLLYNSFRVYFIRDLFVINTLVVYSVLLISQIYVKYKTALIKNLEDLTRISINISFVHDDILHDGMKYNENSVS